MHACNFLSPQNRDLSQIVKELNEKMDSLQPEKEILGVIVTVAIGALSLVAEIWFLYEASNCAPNGLSGKMIAFSAATILVIPISILFVLNKIIEYKKFFETYNEVKDKVENFPLGKFASTKLPDDEGLSSPRLTIEELNLIGKFIANIDTDLRNPRLVLTTYEVSGGDTTNFPASHLIIKSEQKILENGEWVDLLLSISRDYPNLEKETSRDGLDLWQLCQAIGRLIYGSNTIEEHFHQVPGQPFPNGYIKEHLLFDQEDKQRIVYYEKKEKKVVLPNSSIGPSSEKESFKEPEIKESAEEDTVWYTPAAIKLALR